MTVKMPSPATREEEEEKWYGIGYEVYLFQCSCPQRLHIDQVKMLARQVRVPDEYFKHFWQGCDAAREAK